MRPPNAKSSLADAAKALFTVSDGDHLTMLNVFNQYMLSMSTYSLLYECPSPSVIDKYKKNWTYNNFLSARALMQAENVRAQLRRTMERYEVEFVSHSNEKKLYQNIRQALVCGFYMQIAHKEGQKGNYLTVKDDQVVALHPSCGLDTQPEWVLFHEFILTKQPYLRVVTDVRPEWYTISFVHLRCWRSFAFVGFVEDNGGIALQLGVVHGFAQKHIVRHILQERRTWFCHVVKTSGVPDLTT